MMLKDLALHAWTKRALFVTFEGPEGSGKSTQLRRLGERLRSAGRDVVETREPGGTPIGTQIRRILLDAENRELCATAELLLMFASRAQNVDQCILPALASGCIVLSDRFTDSTLAYQGAGRGLDTEIVRQLNRIACRGLVPDLTLLVDIDTDIGLARARSRNDLTGDVETRLDEEAVAFHRKVRQAFHEHLERPGAALRKVESARLNRDGQRKVRRCTVLR
jgi:dTMP kinase